MGRITVLLFYGGRRVRLRRKIGQVHISLELPFQSMSGSVCLSDVECGGFNVAMLESVKTSDVVVLPGLCGLEDSRIAQASSER
jgi:hypothetical protein